MAVSSENRKTLVVGGAGMLGSQLVRLLAERGWPVLGLDNFSGPASRKNIEDLPGLVREYDVLRDPLPEDGDAGYLVFCAGPPPEKEGSEETLQLEAEGLGRCLDFAVRRRLVFLYVSSDAVYGDSGNETCQEENAVHPAPPWWTKQGMETAGKRFGEARVLACLRGSGLQARVARVFALEGRGLHEGHWLGGLKKRLEDTRFGGLRLLENQTVSLCPAEYAAEGLFRLLRANYTTPLNIGNPGTVPLESLMDTLIKEQGKGSYRVVTKRFGSVVTGNRIPDVRNAERVIGWVPSF